VDRLQALFLSTVLLGRRHQLQLYDRRPGRPETITSLLQTVIESFVAFIAAHGSYTLFWNRRRHPVMPACLSILTRSGARTSALLSKSP